jgi:rhodanese-related sulfurtransferase
VLDIALPPSTRRGISRALARFRRASCAGTCAPSPETSTSSLNCRGPYCVFADDVVRELTRRGYRAGRLEDGFPEWQRDGLPVEAGVGGGS